MNLLRNQREVSLQNLLVACRESVDLYNDAAEWVDSPAVTRELREIAIEREPFVARLEESIKQLGDLPSAPDADKETAEMIIGHLRASISPDSTAQMLELRREGERYIGTLIDEARRTELDEAGASLVDAIAGHVARASERLSTLKQQAGG